MPILRLYQQEALAKSKRKFLDEKITRQLIALPTGTGKTVVFAHLLSHHCIDKRMLVLVHRQELADQAERKLRQCNPGMRVGVEMGDSDSRGERIVVAGVQTIGTLVGAGRLSYFNPDRFGVIVCDEAHHALASTYTRVFEHFGLFRDDNKKLLLGVTATPVRGDGRGLNGVFQEIVYSMSILDAITGGWLCDLRACRIRTTVDLDSVRAKPNGDFVADELGSTVNTNRRNSFIVRNWLELAANRQTVVFCVTIQHARALAEAFKAEGVKADCIWGDDSDRSAKLDMHKRGEIAVLTNCGVLTEGYDDWQISCVLLARPTKSELLFTQMIGRGTRIEEGIDNLVEARRQQLPIRKPDCLIIDVVDNTREHRLVTLATLFGYDVDHDFRGARISEAGREGNPNAPTEPHLVPEAKINELTALVEQVDLFAPKWRDDLLNRSVLKWFRTGNSFHLPLPGGERISIEHNGGWRALGTIGGQRFGFNPSDSFAGALAQAENVFRIHGASIAQKIRNEEQSPSASITPIQMELLRSITGEDRKPDLTRDQAAHRIAALYERQLNARCVSELPPEEDIQPDGDPNPKADLNEVEAPATAWIMPQPWNRDESSQSALQWYRTDEKGYAMPLPDMGEIFLLPKDDHWQLSGEICGVKIDERHHETIEAALAAAKCEMERIGPEVVAVIERERDWAGDEPTPLQRALLKNLFGLIEAQRVDDRCAAQQLIQLHYKCEYNPCGPERSTANAYAEELMTRYGLSIEGILEAVQEPE